MGFGRTRTTPARVRDTRSASRVRVVMRAVWQAARAARHFPPPGKRPRPADIRACRRRAPGSEPAWPAETGVFVDVGPWFGDTLATYYGMRPGSRSLVPRKQRGASGSAAFRSSPPPPGADPPAPMPRRPRHPTASTPRVALLVETSLASGRDILRGIARYVREHGPWSLYHEAHSLEAGLPRWLARWTATASSVSCRSTPHRRGRPGQRASGGGRTRGRGIRPAAAGPRGRPGRGMHGGRAPAGAGAHHFAYFGILGENWSARRREAFRQAVGVNPGKLPVCELPRRSMESNDWERQENALAGWVQGLPKPTGIMVCSDQVGQHLLEACRRAGVAVPDDVAVVGVDNDEPLCEVCHPPLPRWTPVIRSSVMRPPPCWIGCCAGSGREPPPSSSPRSG